MNQRRTNIFRDLKGGGFPILLNWQNLFTDEIKYYNCLHAFLFYYCICKNMVVALYPKHKTTINDKRK